jgi:hypothetical protein
MRTENSRFGMQRMGRRGSRCSEMGLLQGESRCVPVVVEPYVTPDPLERSSDRGVTMPAEAQNVGTLRRGLNTAL